MILKNLLQHIDYEVLKGNDEVEINNISYNSKTLKPGDLFFCIKGFKVDGHNYIDSAIKNGANAIILEDYFEDFSYNCTVIKVKDTRKALAIAASNYYGNPSSKLKLIGLTGTNGKTTSTYIIKSILEEAGYKVGLIGTIANYIIDKKIEAHHTTPESLELHQLFHEMVEAGVEYCVMEVSSHSLALDRVYGVNFDYGIFTNLTQDHLDFHKNFENYFEAKYKLFENSHRVIINIDDSYGKRVIEKLNEQYGNEKEIFTYSIKEPSDLKAESIHVTSKGINFNLNYKNVNQEYFLPLPGKYNVYNSLAGIGVALKEEITYTPLKKSLERVLVPGRCEIISNTKRDYDIIIDYAHSPDSLENILNTVREFTKGRLITVFGCGGDRDTTKRPIMGSIASNLSDLCIVTSDNPRNEEPMNIIKDIVQGLVKDNYIIIENRKEAIINSLEIAQKDDVIVIAGKGHENYQILKNGTIIHFDEKEIVNSFIENL